MDSWRSSCLLVGAFFAVLKLTTAVAVLQVNCTSPDTECATIANATCNVTAGKCQCVAGYVKDPIKQNTCVKVLGGNCSGTAACTGDANSVCQNSKCACKKDYNEKDGVCAPIVSTTTCTDGSPCTGKANSVCRGGTCVCKDGFVMMTNTCTKILGGNCSGTAACTGDANSVCQNSKCACKKDYGEKDGVCAPNVSGTTCTASGKQCDAINNAECDGTKCRCISGYTMKVDVCAAENAAPSMELGRVAISLSIFMLTLLKKLF